MSRFNSNTPGERVNQRWLPCKNVGSYDIPPHGVVEITGSTNPETGAVLHSVTRPTAANLSPVLVAVNGPTTIPAGKYGAVTQDWPVFALYNTANSPVVGDTWGSAANAFTLSKGNSGFVVVGQSLGAGNTSRVRVNSAVSGTPQIYIGRIIDAVIPGRDYTSYSEGKAASDTVYIVDLTDDSGNIYLNTTTVPQVTAYNVHGLPLHITQLVLVLLEERTNRYIILPFPGGATNKGILLSSTLTNKTTGSYTFELAATHGYETNSNLPIYIDSGDLVIKAATALDYAGVAVSFSAHITFDTHDQHPTLFVYDSVFVDSSLTGLHGYWSILRPPATLTDSRGDTISISIGGESPGGNIAGLSCLPTPFSDTTIQFTMDVGAPSGSVFDVELRVYARLYGIGDSYDHASGP